MASGSDDHIKSVQDLLNNARSAIPPDSSKPRFRDRRQQRLCLQVCEGYLKAALAVVQSLQKTLT